MGGRTVDQHTMMSTNQQGKVRNEEHRLTYCVSHTEYQREFYIFTNVWDTDKIMSYDRHWQSCTDTYIKLNVCAYVSPCVFVIIASS